MILPRNGAKVRWSLTERSFHEAGGGTTFTELLSTVDDDGRRAF